MKYLGVPLENYVDSDPYWRSQTVELREKAEKWKGSGLSIFARASVCNVFLISKLWYVLQVLPCTRLAPRFCSVDLGVLVGENQPYEPVSARASWWPVIIASVFASSGKSFFVSSGCEGLLFAHCVSGEVGQSAS